MGGEPHFVRHFLRIVIPAVAMAALGLAMLARQYRSGMANLETFRQTLALRLADDMRDCVREAGESQKARNETFALWRCAPESARPGAAIQPRGRFVWMPRKGIVWHDNGAADAVAMLAKRTRWNEWTGSRKRPPQRAAEFLKTDGGAVVHVLWGRVDGALYGLVFDEFPVSAESWTWLWLAGVCLAGLVALVLVSSALRLWRAAENARRDDEQKTRFVSDVSHELKTPLAAMGIWADMLAGGMLKTEERRRHALEVIAAEKNRMLRLVDSLLEFSRLEQHRRKYRMEKIDLAETARSAADVLRGEFGGREIAVSGEEVCAMADRDAVKEIFLNLLGNAAKYAAGAKVEVSVRASDGRAIAEVSDEGPGIPPEMREKVFGRFCRLRQADAAAKGGFGLGLPISRRLARGMGGELSLRPGPGGSGCVFSLELPAE